MDSRLLNPLPPQQPPAYFVDYPIHHQPPPPPQPQQYQQQPQYQHQHPHQQQQQQQQHFQQLHGGLVGANSPGMGVAVAAPMPSSAAAHPYSVGTLSPVTSLSCGQGFYTLESLEAGASMHSAVTDPVQHGYEMVSTGHSYLSQKPPGVLVFPPSQETTQVGISPGLTDAYLSQARLPGFHSGQESASAAVHPGPGHVYGWTGQSEQQVDRPWVQPWSQERTLAQGSEPRQLIQWPRLRHQKKSKAIGLNVSSATMAKPGIPSTGKAKGQEKSSAWCSVCQIDCTSAVILKQHMAGKKHKRRLERECSEPAGKQQPKPKAQTQKVVADVLISADKQNIQESTDRKNGADMNTVVTAVLSLAEHSQKRRREKDCDPALRKRHQTVPLNDPNEEKARKTPVSFEKCEICNITCTSKAILETHFTGKKHAARIRRLNKEEPVPKGDGKGEEKISTPACVGTDGDGKAGRGDNAAMDEDNAIVFPQSSSTEVAGESTVHTANAAGQTVIPAVLRLAEHSQQRRREKDRDPALKKHHQTVPLNGPNEEKAQKTPVSFEKCEICNITCTSKAILETHFTGKKHAARIRRLNKEEPVPKGDGKGEDKLSTPACVGTDGDGQAGRGDKAAMNEDNAVVFPQSSSTEVAGESTVITADAAGQTVITA